MKKKWLYSPISFSPFDLSAILFISTFFLVWKFVTNDFTALADLKGGPTFKTVHSMLWWLNPDYLRDFLLQSAMSIRTTQIVCGALALVAAWKKNRWLMIIAMIPIISIEQEAQKYRGRLYDYETLFPVIFLFLIWPGRWKALFEGGRKITREATAVGRSLVAFVGMAYFFAGIGKYWFDSKWWQNIHLENLYQVMFVVHGSENYPWPLNHTVMFIHEFMGAYPVFSTLSALLVLIVEIGWITSLLSPICRWFFVPAMVAIHFIIFFGSGIFFFTWICVWPCLFVAWRSWIPENFKTLKVAKVSQKEKSVGWGIKTLGFTSLAILLVSLPTIRKQHMFPFQRYETFAWHYARWDEAVNIRYGYVDEKGEAKHIPMNHGGFMDFMWILGQYSPQDCSSAELSLQYIKLLRGYDSHHWLLGPFAAPMHHITIAEPVELNLDQIHIVKGTYKYTKNSYDTQWESLGRLVDLAEKACPERYSQK